jgi:hypothetical protein
MDPPLIHAGMYLLWVLIGVIAIANVWTVLYSVHEVSVFSKNEQGHWAKLANMVYGFPFSRHEINVAFDRITSIRVNQGSIDRFLNTGGLIIKMVLYESGGSTDEHTFIIAGIIDPHGAKSRLEDALAQNAGLKIQIAT